MKVSQFKSTSKFKLLPCLLVLGVSIQVASSSMAIAENAATGSSPESVPAPAASPNAQPVAKEPVTQEPVAREKDSNFDPPKTYTAKFYEMDTQPRKLLFVNKHVSSPTEKGFLFTNTYSDPDGNVVAVETTDVIRDGDQLRVHLYKISQKQTGSEGSVEVKDGKANFQFTKDGKTKTASESVGDDFVVGPTLLSYLHHRYDTIRKGGKVKARFVVLDRLETVGFEYFEEKQLDYHGKKARMIKMKPSSFLVAAVVDPLHFIVPLDGTRVWEVDGRTQLKYKVGDSLKDLDADTVYEYPDVSK